MTKIKTPVRQIKLSDNVHPNCNGSPWGWLVFKDSPRTRVATYSGYEEKARCRELADALNHTADLEALVAENESLKDHIQKIVDFGSQDVTLEVYKEIVHHESVEILTGKPSGYDFDGGNDD